MEITIEITDKDGSLKDGRNDYEDFKLPMRVVAKDSAILATQNLEYKLGDKIKVTTSENDVFLVVKLDETLDSSLVYLKGNSWEYELPLADNWIESFPDSAFIGKRHYISVRKAEEFEITAYRNLALNPHALKDDNHLYPFASANVETRNDSTFFARNAIDGYKANLMHGEYPYQSWGINQNPDAKIRIDFGRVVEIDRIDLVLRADYPHDSYWTSVTANFSDASEEVFQTTNALGSQSYTFEKRQVEWVELCRLIKADTESPFPALTEIEVFGQDIITK